jgi:hypothetical protein
MEDPPSPSCTSWDMWPPGSPQKGREGYLGLASPETDWARFVCKKLAGLFSGTNAKELRNRDRIRGAAWLRWLWAGVGGSVLSSELSWKGTGGQGCVPSSVHVGHPTTHCRVAMWPKAIPLEPARPILQGRQEGLLRHARTLPLSCPGLEAVLTRTSHWAVAWGVDEA